MRAVALNAAGAGLCLALICPASSQADDSLALIPARDQCKPIYAVHKDSCLLEKFYRCESDGRGTIRAENHSEHGMFSIDYTDLNGNTLLSWSKSGYANALSILSIGSVISYEDLKQDGTDNFDITHMVDNKWFADPIEKRFHGTITLTGETVEIDGVLFEQGAMSANSVINAHEEMTDEGYLYFDFERGINSWASTRPEREKAGFDIYAPMKVVFPDDPDFQSNEPQYGCGTLSQVSPEPLRRAKG